MGEVVNYGDALMSLNIGLLVLVLASWLATGLQGPRLCVTPLRNFFSAYALTISIATVSLLAHLVFSQGFTIQFLSIPDPGPHGGTSLSYPTRVLVKRYMDYAHEAYLGVHYPNGTVRPGIPSNVSSLFHGSVMETPHWMTLANQTDGVQVNAPRRTCAGTGSGKGVIMHHGAQTRWACRPRVCTQPMCPQLRVSWWIGLPAEGMQYVFGFLFSIPITMFFIVDQLVSAGLAQPKELRMTKGRFYHSVSTTCNGGRTRHP